MPNKKKNNEILTTITWDSCSCRQLILFCWSEVKQPIFTRSSVSRVKCPEILTWVPSLSEKFAFEVMMPAFPGKPTASLPLPFASSIQSTWKNHSLRHFQRFFQKTQFLIWGFSQVTSFIWKYCKWGKIKLTFPQTFSSLLYTLLPPSVTFWHNQVILHINIKLFSFFSWYHLHVCSQNTIAWFYQFRIFINEGIHTYSLVSGSFHQHHVCKIHACCTSLWFIRYHYIHHIHCMTVTKFYLFYCWWDT